MSIKIICYKRRILFSGYQLVDTNFLFYSVCDELHYGLAFASLISLFFIEFQM